MNSVFARFGGNGPITGMIFTGLSGTFAAAAAVGDTQVVVVTAPEVLPGDFIVNGASLTAFLQGFYVQGGGCLVAGQPFLLVTALKIAAGAAVTDIQLVVVRPLTV